MMSYKSAVVDYAFKYAKPASWYWVNNTNLFNDALSTILAPCWSGNATVVDAITQSIDNAQSRARRNVSVNLEGDTPPTRRVSPHQDGV